MNNDVFVSDPAWLRAMVGEMLADPQVGIVGNKLLYPSGKVQHGGVILVWAGGLTTRTRALAQTRPGMWHARSAHRICPRSRRPVCCAKRAVFQKVGGFDEKDLRVAFNDVDLCLRVGGSRVSYRVDAWLGG